MSKTKQLFRRARSIVRSNNRKSIAQGGFLKGPKHTEGGIPVINKSTGQPLEVEGGEVVITAPAVSDNKLHEFEGKKMTNRQILSAINQDAGGVAFAKGGKLPKKIRCSGKMYKYGGEMKSDYEIVKGCGCKHSKVKSEKSNVKMEGGGKTKKILQHKHYPGMTAEVVKYNDNGSIKVILTDLTAPSAKLRKPKNYTITNFEKDQWEIKKMQSGGEINRQFSEMPTWELEAKLKLLQKENAAGNADATTDKVILAIMGEINRRQGEMLAGRKMQTGGEISRKTIPLPDLSKVDITNSQAYQHYKRGGMMAKGGQTIPKLYPTGENELPPIVNEYKEGGDIELPAPTKKGIRQIELKLKDRKDFGDITFRTSADIYNYLWDIWDRDTLNILEKSYVIYLNRANKLIGYQELSIGGVTGTVVDPEIIVATASKALARNVVVAHNHPSGNLTPSRADEELTSKVKQALTYIDCRLLDHVIMTPDKGTYYSFADEGILAKGGMLAKGGRTMQATTEDDQLLIKKFSANKNIIRPFTPKFQMDHLTRLFNSEERDGAIDITDRLVSLIQQLPKTYGTEGQETDDKVIYLHYFYAGSDWYIVEKDMEPEQLQAFGYVILNGHTEDAEWGYVSIEEIKSIGKIELDFYWTPITFGQLKKKWEPQEEEYKDDFVQRADDGRFFYGERFGVPFEHSSDLKADLQKYGFTLVNEDKNAIYIDKKPGQVLAVSDNGGEFSVLKPTGPGKYEHVAAIAYDRTDGIARPSELAERINEIYDDYFAAGSKQPQSEKSIAKSAPQTKQAATTTLAQQADINAQIRKLVKQNGADRSKYSAADLALLKQYEGAGSEKKTSTDARILDQFFTPMDICAKMWGLAFKHGFKFPGSSILEPAVGSGRFLSFIPGDVNVFVEAYDVDEIAANICKVLYPHVQVHHDSFESLFFKGKRHVGLAGVNTFFDLVIGNPPYREYVSKYAPLGEKDETGAATFESYFILRGVDVLKPGGLLCFIIPNTFLSNDSKYNAIKEKIAKKADLVDAYRLPNGVFGNTDVGTDIIVLKKK